MFRQAQGANNQAMAFGKSRAKPLDQKGKKRVTFKDVAGVDEAVEEVHEIVDFLKYPAKFHALGAKIPKGVLLMGPPGCGKTLLARAIAGEANVAFFSISGSDFVEMFVGVGASRVRDLFNQAKKAMPSIIFVDELDAVGRHRGAGLGGGHDEREQTLNQLLVEMDGFDQKSSVIIIAATNRPDILDPALLRPGRFDRQVVVDKPDLKGRKEILAIHTKDVIMEKNINLDIIARRTPGFTGADLANVINEGALLAARRGKKIVRMNDLEDAIERVLAGPEKKSKVISPKEKEVIAYHELGHAIVAKHIPGTDPVHKISILPRGMALGYTLQLPLEDKYLVSKKEIENQITILLGGRVAEDMVFSEITSGASNDIERATILAHKMVCEYGMSSLGSRTFGRKQEQVFLGRDFTQHDRDYGHQLADQIDSEMNKIIEQSYAKARKILYSSKKKLNEIAKILIQKETIEGEQFEELLGGKKKTPRQAPTRRSGQARGKTQKREDSSSQPAATTKPATQVV
ncbi:MAG: ATP-dependent zinc metalloprotease FtsH [Candidatus Margulisbacteria bacterium]|nr:ATP-dependent zinc metalloprotease FtsH [Candidatus Margulisiibacteriota bacterium]